MVRRVCAEPELLRQNYQLDAREIHRLTLIVRHRGMACNCMLYRVNRLAPLIRGLAPICSALGTELAPLAHEFWSQHPGQNPNSWFEMLAFCRFLLAHEPTGALSTASLQEQLRESCARLSQAIAAEDAFDGRSDVELFV
jgi:hypothetical protein